MPSTAHEVLVSAIGAAPMLLSALSARLVGRALTLPRRPADSTVRLTRPVEVRPDLLFVASKRRWTALEVQGRIDWAKLRRWPLAASLLHDRYRTMGDLVVVTSSHAVARWAAAGVSLAGDLGTRLRLDPVVLLLDGARAETLLDDAQPELALFAAWAVHGRHGRRAREIVRRALELTNGLPRRLRQIQIGGILDVLDRRILAWLKEKVMPKRVSGRTTTSHWVREFDRYIMEKARRSLAREIRESEEAELKGRRVSLLKVLEARGLLAQGPRKARARVAACEDAKTLERWIMSAATATMLDEALTPEPAPAAATPKAKRSATRKPSSKAAPRRAAPAATPSSKATARRATTPSKPARRGRAAV